jgi:hypothetical protein
VANRHLYKRDEVTSRPISKRKAAPLILNELEAVGTAERVVRAIITITAGWNAYHLADDEYQARATVHKARDLLGVVEEMEAREESQREWARRDAQAVFDRERAELLRKHSALLVAMFDIMAAQEPHERGYLLQECIGQLFQLFGIPVIRSFTRNSSGEQIDGGIRLEGRYYLIECRWRQRLSDMRELDGLSGQVQRSGKQTMGMFLPINGWSENVPQLLKQNPERSIILMDGYDVRTVLAANVDLKDFLLGKLAALNYRAEPHFSIQQYLNENRASR